MSQNPETIFQELLTYHSVIDDFYNKNKSSDEIILFGVGFAINQLIQKFEKHKINIVAICDNSKEKHGTYINDKYLINSLKECQIKFPNATYVISSHKFFWEIYEELSHKISVDKLCKVDFECSHYFSGKEFQDYFKANMNNFIKVYNMFSDDFSKDLYIKVLKAHFTGKREDFDNANTGNEDWYLFKSLLKTTKNSIYVDCGAFDGDTVKLFSDSVKGCYKKIYALEPDELIQPKLINTIEKHKIENVEVVKKGAFSQAKTVSFEQNGFYSNIKIEGSDDTNYVTIQVDALDSILKEKVDIIKMDIEGAEFEALKGAKYTIQKDSPKLAICLYHDLLDFVRIPLLIKEYQSDYSFYLRHQSYGCTDTILFAVKE